ncbi:MAG: TolC family protein, partial [Dysgonamonadaceae bacterium]
MRKTNKIYSLIALMFCFAFCIQSLSAQETWTLRKCIDYAREHNIQVQKSQTTAQGYQVDVLQSRAALFPSLTGSTTQQFSNSKTVDGNGNYKYEGTLSGAYSLNASWTVYNGGKNKLAIKQAGMTKQAQDLTTQQQQNSIEISITQAYLQLLYYRESIKNYENLLETSTAELKQADLFLSAGTITRSDHAQVEAEYSSTKYNLVSARNSYDTYLVQLKQLLELEPQDSFRVEFPEVNENQVMQIIPAKEDVYRTALSIMPEVENSRMGVDIAKLTRQSAKAGYLPSIAIVGSVGTGNVYNQSTAFTTQLNRNFGQSLGLTVSIPIFDNRQNKSNVQ